MLRVACYGIRVASCGVCDTRFELRVTGYGLRVARCGVRVIGFEISDCWIPAFAGMTGVINPIVIPAQAGIQFDGLCGPLDWHIGEKRRFRETKVGRATVPAKI